MTSVREIISVYDKLSYLTQKKTDKITSLKKEINQATSTMTAFYLLATVSFVYVLNNFYVYLYSYIPTFGLISYKTEPINLLHNAILLSFIISIGYIFLKTSSVARLKSQYQNLRLDIMNSIGNGFCIHNHSCNCRDEYIKDMSRLGIDLIFK